MRLSPLRIVLVLLTALAALQIVLAWVAFRAQWRELREDAPHAARVAAMVEALDGAHGEQRERLLQAFAGAESVFELAADVPEGGARPGLRAIERRYRSELQREVRVWRHFDPWPRTVIAVRLADGAWLTIQPRRAMALRVLGIPPGVLAGMIAVLVAIGSLFALWRGLWPLDALARRIDAFAKSVAPEALPERGPEETRRIIAACNQMQSEIARLIAERAAIFAGLSHDLRTYLTRLRLRVEALDGQAREKSIAEIEAMSAIVDQAVLFARLHNDAPIERHNIDLIALLSEAAAAHCLALREVSGPAMVPGDRTLLRRAIDNLIDNAQRHGGGGELRLERTALHIDVVVADRGPGIADVDKLRVRRLFERGDVSRTMNAAGSGLGLAIVERIALQHGGALLIEDREGGGLAVRLRLPTKV